MKLVDSHAHLDFPRFDKDRQQLIKKSFADGMKYIINTGANLSSSRRSLELALNYEKIFATVGVHPHDAEEVDSKAIKILKDLSKADKVVAIGEIGLDFYYDNSPRQIQKQAFIEQLRLAAEISLPVVIHAREAKQETIEILKNELTTDRGGVLHCFSGDFAMARQAMDLGLFIGIGGIITFKNARQLREVVSKVPLDMILIETDCPYLSPEPFRGKRNQPLYVKYVARKIAEIKDVSLDKVARVTAENAEKLFNLNKGE